MPDGKFKFRVAVCGGGIGGLTFAVAMAKYPDVRVEIYESTARFTPAGAVLAFGHASGLRSLIGLGDLATKASSQPGDDEVHAFTFRKSDQLEGIKFMSFLLKDHFSRFTRLKAYNRRSDETIDIAFHDGSTATCDVLVGADGIKSAVRSHFLRQQAQDAVAAGNPEVAKSLLSSIQPSWTGTVAYRAVIQLDDLKDEIASGCLEVPNCPTQHMGKNGNVILYPISNGRFMNVAAFRAKPQLAGTLFDGPWVTRVGKEELVDTFAGWEPNLVAWLKRVESPTRWAIHTIKPLPCIAADGVVLLGDAAHAMTPHQGSGAGQAVEDAFFLAMVLGHRATTVETLDRAISVYDAIRRPFSTDIAQRSSQNGRFFTFNYEDADINLQTCGPEENMHKLRALGDAIYDNWKWTWSTSLDEMMQEGADMLEEATSVARPGCGVYS
ncbi:salicylate 1-monooxygenase [Infundibulicybe gibba]|nr:salicylate 1-monooxygenase [Infundibulicybe gibba]